MRLVPYALLGISAVAILPGCGTDNACTTSGGVTVCGEFGKELYVVQLSPQMTRRTSWQQDTGPNAVQWPPIAVQQGRIVVARGSELIEVRADGKVSKLVDGGSPLSVPSADDVGGLYAIGNTFGNTFGTDSGGASVLAWDPANGTTTNTAPRWSTSISGSPVGTPPSLGKDIVYAATSSSANGGTLYILDRKSGKVLRERSDASPAAVLPDGSVRYLAGAKGQISPGGAPQYANLVAEAADGTTLWTFTAKEGIVDFAPGPNGETYVVSAGNHELSRVSADGTAEWSFIPPCTDCTVAGAPTVADGNVYFPVWENVSRDPIDPLYALRAQDGKQLWTFDGFDTTEVSYAPYKLLDTPVNKTRTTHHPWGRPVVAQDGTLFVSNDGAVAALDKNGQMLGLAMYDSQAGEVHWEDSFIAPAQTWINPGVRPSPVLAPDGVLYVWDGVNVRAFQTGRPAADQAWIAPFGGPSNSGRIQ